jgi:hypothetical protein
MTLLRRGARVAATVTMSLSFFAAGCKTTEPATADLQDAQAGTPAGTAPKLCVGVHGNGNLIMSHFGSYARIVEHYGLFDGASGGSSGSISLFLYESIIANKALRQCANGACSPAEEGMRAGLLLKSLQGYLAYIGSVTDEAAVFRGLVPVYRKAKEQDMDSLLLSDKLKARNLLVKLLESPDVRDIVNKELLHLLKNSPDPAYHTKTIYEGLANASEWRTDDPIILVRPGVIDFGGLARKIGRIANFYAGYGPADETGTKKFLDSCATTDNRGKSWDEIAGKGENTTACGRMYFELLHQYRSKLLANEAGYPSRIEDDIGLYLPVLISTSILEGQRAAGRFATARRNFLAGKPLEWESDFADVRFGYWGREADLQLVRSNPRNFSDLKTKRFLALGQKKWKEALQYSPAEPGLSRAQEMSDTRISAGGWSDLHPVLPLQNMGCKAVVYVTRRGEESGFNRGIATLFGMRQDEDAQLYPLDPASDGTESSYRLAVKQADGMWCTNWNDAKTADVAGTVADAYNAPIEVRTGMTPALVPYQNTSSSLGLRSCTHNAPRP